MSEPFIGEIVIFAGNFAPRGWAFCEGQLLPISQNSALFSILGTIYGGDGRTTFGLPDLRGRAPIGPGNGPGLRSYRQGERGGVEFVTLNVTQMPSHSHQNTAQLRANSADGVSNTPVGTALAVDTGGNMYHLGTDANMSADSIVMTNANTGGSQAFDNRQPYLAIYYIIALQGVYPSRS